MYRIDRASHRQVLRDIKKLKSEDVDVTADIFGPAFNITSLTAGNVWESKDTIRLHKDKVSIVSEAIASVVNDKEASRADQRSPKVKKEESEDSDDKEDSEEVDQGEDVALH